MFQRLFGHKAQRPSSIQHISPTELNQRLQIRDSLLLVDVRWPDEYSQDGHIAGSRLLPLQALRQRCDELPQDQPIVFICRSGRRSQAACEQLAGLGFTNLINLAGGIMSWRQANLPVQH